MVQYTLAVALSDGHQIIGRQCVEVVGGPTQVDKMDFSNLARVVAVTAVQISKFRWVVAELVRLQMSLVLRLMVVVVVPVLTVRMVRVVVVVVVTTIVHLAASVAVAS